MDALLDPFPAREIQCAGGEPEEVQQPLAPDNAIGDQIPFPATHLSDLLGFEQHRTTAGQLLFGTLTLADVLHLGDRDLLVLTVVGHSDTEDHP